MSAIGDPSEPPAASAPYRRVCLFPAVDVEAQGGVIADAGLLAHRGEHVRGQ
jgi:hypothetical protein